MPIYEYKCLGCGAHIEKMQKVSDEPLKTCEACGGELEKQISLAGFQFKGAGWYVTDYSNKSKDSGAEKTSGAGKAVKEEKTSAAESTAATDAASKNSNDAAKPSANDASAKKD